MTLAASPDTQRTALIVDDLRINRTLLRHTLASLRYATTEAADGSAALRALDARRFDIVFLDWELPGVIKGDQIARHLRSQPAHADTLLIAISNDTSEIMRQRYALVGTDLVLGKAFDPTSVQNAITIASAGVLSDKNTANHPATPGTGGSKIPHFPSITRELIPQWRSAFLAEHRQLGLSASASLWPDAARAAHNLGALAAIIGLPDIREATRRCEIVLRAGDPTLIPPVLGEMDVLVSQACAALSAFDESA